MPEQDEDDPVLRELLKAQKVITEAAIKNGFGPTDGRKSEFKTEKDRALFIDAWGMDAYRKLRD